MGALFDPGMSLLVRVQLLWLLLLEQMNSSSSVLHFAAAGLPLSLSLIPFATTPPVRWCSHQVTAVGGSGHCFCFFFSRNSI